MSTPRHNLYHILQRMNGAAFFGIDTLVPVKLTGGKANPNQGQVTKSVTGSSVICYQNKFVNGYEAAIQRRLVKEGKDPASFSVGPRVWGTRLDGLPIVEHKGEYYMELIYQHRGKTEVMVGGVPTPPNTIQGYPDDKEEGEQGGLEDKVIIRTVKLANIKAIRFAGKEYVGEFYFDANEALVGDTATVVDQPTTSISEIPTLLTKLTDGTTFTIEDMKALRKLSVEISAFMDQWVYKALSGATKND